MAILISKQILKENEKQIDPEHYQKLVDQEIDKYTKYIVVEDLENMKNANVNASPVKSFLRGDSKTMNSLNDSISLLSTDTLNVIF